MQGLGFRVWDVGLKGLGFLEFRVLGDQGSGVGLGGAILLEILMAL